MGSIEAPSAIAQAFGASGPLQLPGDPRCDILHCAWGHPLADAAQRDAAVEDLLLLLHGLAQRGFMAATQRPVSGKNSSQSRKKKAPSAAIIDSQSVKVSNHGGVRGYDAGKKVMGRKRHLLVDTVGLVLTVCVHPANIQDRDGAKLVFERLKGRLGTLKLVWADGGYQGKLIDWLEGFLPWRQMVLEIVKRKNTGTFEVLPRRWVVERTFGWLTHYRRLNRDYETRTDSSEAMVLIASVRLMTKRLAR